MKNILLILSAFLSLSAFSQGLITNEGIPIYFLHGGHRAGMVTQDTTIRSYNCNTTYNCSTRYGCDIIAELENKYKIKEFKHEENLEA